MENEQNSELLRIQPTVDPPTAPVVQPTLVDPVTLVEQTPVTASLGVEPGKPQQRLELFEKHDPKSLQRGIILAELLGAPVSKRRGRRRWL